MSVKSQKKSYNKESEFMRVRSVAEELGVNKSTIYRWAAAGKFAKPLKLSRRVTVFRRSEVTESVNAMINNSITTEIPKPSKSGIADLCFYVTAEFERCESGEITYKVEAETCEDAMNKYHSATPAELNDMIDSESITSSTMKSGKIKAKA